MGPSENPPKPIWAIVITLAAVALATALILRQYSQTPTKAPQKLPEFKNWTLRIDDIPITTDKHQLEQDLRSAVEANPSARGKISDIAVRSLVLRNPSSATATVIVSSTLPDGQLCERLRQSVPSDCPYDFTHTFDGITPIYTSDNEADVDIIAVTGLAGHALGSWKAKGGNDVWLRDFLPEDTPNIRVLLYGYDTKLQHSITKQCIADLGYAFLEHLVAFRTSDKTSRRPIVFIGHSLGGLVIKQGLIKAYRERDRDEDFLDLYKACYGMLFFGVPNSGLRHRELEELVKGKPNEELVRELIVDEDGEPRPYLRSLKDQFSECGKDMYDVVPFYERVHTPTVKVDENGKASRTGKERLHVSVESAWDTGLESQSRGVPLDADHSGIVKYGSRSSGIYPITRRHLQRLVNEAPAKVSARFDYYLAQPLTKVAEDCLRYLAFPDMNSRHDTIERATDGTCRWIFEHESFKRWCTDDRGLLWIQGNPGSGKSTLMEFAVREFLSEPGNATVVSFFCHGRGHELQKSPLGLLRSVLHQLLRRFPNAFSQMTNEFAQNQKTKGKAGKDWNWHHQQLQDFLFSGLSRVLQHSAITFFFDALDEFGDQPARELVDFFGQLPKRLPHTGHMFNLCFSCRYYPILVFDAGSEIEVEKRNHDDIAAYIRSRLDKELLHEIGHLIIDNSRGIFMWARLVVDLVINLRSQRHSLARIGIEIQKVPHKLEDLYRDLLQNDILQDENKRTQSLALFQWVCFSGQPLEDFELPWAIAMTVDYTMTSPEEYEQAADFIAFDDVIPRVKALSCGLVEASPRSADGRETLVFQFIHQSVKDFFVEGGLRDLETMNQAPQKSSPKVQRSLYQDAHMNLSLACICAMKLLATSEELPFSDYARSYWSHHFARGEPESVHCNMMAEALGQSLSSPLNALKLHSSSDETKSGLTLVHVFAYLGLESLGDLLASGGEYMTQADTKDKYGRTPLWYAARGGHVSVIQTLLDTGKVEIDTKSFRGSTPLAIAVKNYHENVVRMLLQKEGVDNSRDDDGQTPLHSAAVRGSETIIRMLLDTGEVDVNSRDDEGQTPLHFAARNGSETIIRMLLDTGEVDVNSRDDDGQTPLHFAARNGSKTIIRMLLDTGEVDINTMDNNGDTPLLVAAMNGHPGFLRALLDTGMVDVTRRNNNGQTPLHMACEGEEDVENEEVLTMLLKIGAFDINSRDIHGQTPLSIAAEYGNERCVRILLSCGEEVDVDSRDFGFRTPFPYAAGSRNEVGSVSLMRCLLARGHVDADSPDQCGWTPLCDAAAARNRVGVKFLSKTIRVNLGSRDNAGRTPLYHARKPERYRNRDILTMLMDAKMQRRLSRKTFLARHSGQITIRMKLKPRHPCNWRLVRDRALKTSTFLWRHSGRVQAISRRIDGENDDSSDVSSSAYWPDWEDQVYGRYIYRNGKFWLKA